MLDLKTLDGTYWLCEPARLGQLVGRAVAMPCPTAREVARARAEHLEEARQAASRAVRTTKGKVGVIPVHGPIDQRMSTALWKLGGTSTEEISLALDTLLEDATVSAIVLHVDSPGGHIYGIEELSDKIYHARNRKPIYASADSVAASAAYWIATAAGHLSVTPGGDVGSVGVYCVHVDESKALEAEGLKVTLVSAGKFKVELAPFAPLGEDARGHLQEMVEYTYNKLLQALKRNRNTTLDDVRKNYGQGRLVNAEQAEKAKMVDKVMTFEELIGKLTGSESSTGSKAAEDPEILRLRQQQRKRRGEYLELDCLDEGN
jgi:signal peptide peptidase SppA